MLLEVRGGCGHIPEKSGGCFSVLSIALHSRWSTSSGGKANPTDESILHVALREAEKEVAIDDDKIGVLGRLGPPTRSLSGLRVWPYRVVSSEACARVSVK